MKIGLDFDGVIADSHSLKLVAAKEKFGVDIPPEKCRREIVVASGLLTREQYREVCMMAMDGSYPIPLVPRVLMHLPFLFGGKHFLKIITSRTGEMLELAKDWLAKHDIPKMPIQGVGEGLPKTEACEGLDVYVDDDLDKLLPLIGHVPKLYLFSWPWNLHEKEPEGIKRVRSWCELYCLFY